MRACGLEMLSSGEPGDHKRENRVVQTRKIKIGGSTSHPDDLIPAEPEDVP